MSSRHATGERPTCFTHGRDAVSPVSVLTSDVFTAIQLVTRVTGILRQIAVLVAVKTHLTVLEVGWLADTRSCGKTETTYIRR